MVPRRPFSRRSLNAWRGTKFASATTSRTLIPPAIIRTWYADLDIKNWISRVEEVMDQTSSTRGLIYAGMSAEEECEASIALMDPYFKKAHVGKGGIRVYRVLDAEKKLLAPVERNDDEDFAVTGVLKPRLRAMNCILSVRQIRDVKNWWLGYGEDIARPHLCAQPHQDVWVPGKVLVTL